MMTHNIHKHTYMLLLWISTSESPLMIGRHRPSHRKMHYLTIQNRITAHRPGELWWTAINRTGTQCAKLIPGPMWALMSLGRGSATEMWGGGGNLTDKPQLKVTDCVGNRLAHMHQITQTHIHRHTHTELMTAKGVWHACYRHRWMYVYFINLPQTWRGGGGTKGRREKEEKKLNVCVQTVTCKDTVPYNLKCLHLSKTFQAAC